MLMRATSCEINPLAPLHSTHMGFGRFNSTAELTFGGRVANMNQQFLVVCKCGAKVEDWVGFVTNLEHAPKTQVFVQ